MLRNRLSKAQKNNISDSCKKPVLTENGFDNHTANLHTKNSPGWADQKYETTEIFEKRIKSTDALTQEKKLLVISMPWMKILNWNMIL